MGQKGKTGHKSHDQHRRQYSYNGVNLQAIINNRLVNSNNKATGVVEAIPFFVGVGTFFQFAGVGRCIVAVAICIVGGEFVVVVVVVRLLFVVVAS